MEIRKTVQVPATAREEVEAVLCDLCEARAERGYWRPDDRDNEVEVEVRLRRGFSCPDGGDGTEIVVDLCPRCFKERLVPWLKSQGVKIVERKWYW